MSSIKPVKIPPNLTKEFRFDGRSLPLLAAVEDIQQMKVGVAIDLTVAAKGLSGMAFENWLIALTWVVKYETKAKTESPFTTTSYKNFKLLGEYLISKLELCYRLLETLAEVGANIPLETDEPVALWKMTVKEEIGNDIYRWVCTQDTSKEAKINDMKGELAALKKFSNPYSPDIMPLNFNLFEAVFSVCTQHRGDGNDLRKARKNLRSKAFKEFVDSYQAWIAKVNDNPAFATAWIEGDRLLTSSKKTKGVSNKRTVYSAS